MPTTPLRLRVPARCKFCGAAGMVRLETTVTGGSAVLSWCCRACQSEWPITRGEAAMRERRIGAPDRRPLPHTERRQD